MDDYLFWGGEDNRGRVILGLPWYGHSWPVQDPEVPTTASGQGVALSFSEIAIDAAEHEATLEPLTRSLYFHKQQAGQTWQVWFEDSSAFAERLQYVEQRDIGGIGIWALGYEGSQTAYWDAIRDAWLAPPTGPVDRHPNVEDAGQIDDADPHDGGGADVDDDAAAPGPDGSDDHPADNPLVTQQESSDLVMRRGCHGAGRGGSGSWFALCVVAMATLASRRWLRV